MEITLEKIELVKDRTGVSYKEAKEALEKSEGSVVDAIIAIEESIDEKTSKSFSKKGEEILNKIKELVKKGNVSKIEYTQRSYQRRHRKHSDCAFCNYNRYSGHIRLQMHHRGYQGRRQCD